MKKCFMALMALAMSLLAANAQTGRSFSVLGDSYSTFKDYVAPDTNICWYALPPTKKKTDVKDVTETWWYLYAKQTGMKICVNNSFSGATICNTGYGKKDYSDRSFITRMNNLGNPDEIIVFGCTNDAWAKAPLGEYVYDIWSKESLYQFRPAMAYMLSYLQKRYVNVDLLFVLNCDLAEDYSESVRAICKHYGVKCIELSGVEKISSHPSVRGMQQICEQIIEAK